MSTALPIVNLSGAIAGQKGSISFQNAGVTSSLNQYKTPAHLQLYNESGCGFNLSFPTGGSATYLPAGGWVTIALTPGESSVNYTIIYVLNNPSVSQLLPIYYAPNESVLDVAQLGNSPIGGSTAVTGVIANQLVDTSNASGARSIIASPSGDAQDAVIVYNNGNANWGDETNQATHTYSWGSKIQIEPTSNHPTDYAIFSYDDINGWQFYGGSAGASKVVSFLPGAGGVGSVQFDLANGSIKASTVQTQLNPSAGGSGSVFCSMDLTGTCKRALLNFNAWKNGSSTVSYTLPVAFTQASFVINTDAPGQTQFKNSGLAQSFQAVGASNGAGGTSGTTAQSGWSYGFVGPFDTIQLAASNASAHSGLMIIEGF